MASTLVFMLLFAFDLVAFGLAFVAEQMRSTAKVVTDSSVNYTYCVYSSGVATKLGITAFALFLASQILTMWATQCVSFGKSVNSGGRRTRSIVLSIIGWITFCLAAACLLCGSLKNAQRTKYRAIIFGDHDLHCQTLREGVFEGGAGFILITSMISKMNYVCRSQSDGGLETENSDSSELGTYTSLN